MYPYGMRDDAEARRILRRIFFGNPLTRALRHTSAVKAANAILYARVRCGVDDLAEVKSWAKKKEVKE